MATSIAVLDFGSQYTQVIARRVRECNVHSRIFPFGVSAAELRAEGVAGVILSGGPASVKAAGSPRPDPEIFNLGVPVLGICYGLQLIAELTGGAVAKSARREYGSGSLTVTATDSRLFAGVKGPLTVWNSHGDKVTRLPKGARAVAKTENSDFAAIEDDAARRYGLQFHPEVNHTQHGVKILRNFLFKICRAKADWKMSNFVGEQVAAVREQVGKDSVLLALSGGVDSSVVAALLHKAIGKQLTCVFVDHGLLRLGEREQVEKMFRGHFKINLVVVDAAERFLRKLRGVTEPERKRKIIGAEFVKVFEEEFPKIAKASGAKWLAQGTIYPDVIESAAIANSTAAVIKSHHNVGGLPKNMKLKLVEPIRELFKDEVRALGLELGLPREMLWRHPFPGPGLGVRVLGEVKREYCDILRAADAIFIEELRTSGWYDKTWQAFAVFIPEKTVGVMGDERTYDYLVGLRAITSTDAMTADWARLPYDLLQRVSNRIINEVKGVNRVVYDISSKPPATIEWE
ncbi:MAG: glutamine-hydrolyzing GMP synthase [Puniceicoccales bacterium]|jgi:GMP synthase (glutamine-hydrolysing)|nr:glutamine-hydrolyzing GMP synthase [Puniceicoccales bacterium]